MSLDAIFRPLATKLLRQLSSLQVVYTRFVPGTYDPETGATSAATETESTVYAYAATPNALKLEAGVVQQGDILIYLSAQQLGFKPSPVDRITYESIDWTIVDIEFISSGTMDALYTVTVRRA